MANEYDQFNEPATSDISLKDALYNILNGFQDKEKLRETGEGLTRLRQSLPGVAESVGRGAIAAVPGSIGDVSEFARTWAPEVMEKKFGKDRFFPTTREILDYIPRMTPTHEGANTLEDVSAAISPGIGGVTKDLALLTKGKPLGLSIMGPESKLWKPEMEFQARKMEAKGATPEEIKQTTGMARGLDTQWRQELSDFWSTMKQKGNSFSDQYMAAKDIDPLSVHILKAEEAKYGRSPPKLHEMTDQQLFDYTNFRQDLIKEHDKLSKAPVLVKDVFEHPELLEAYPELGDIKVKVGSGHGGVKGSYNVKTNELTLAAHLTPEEARSTMLHELTHAIQTKEGMNVGGNPQDMAKWLKEESTKRMDLAQVKLNELDAKIAERRANGISDDDLLQQKFHATNELNDAKKLGERNPYNEYRRLAGEAEARMVQERRDLTEAQLHETYPYAEGKHGLDINPDETIQAKYDPEIFNGPAKSEEKPFAVSTRVPTAVKATEDALKESLLSNYKAFKSDPKAFEHNIDLIKQYPNLALKSKNAEVNAEKFVEHVKDNLLYLHDQVPADTRARSKLWYEGANKIANNMAKDYGISEPAASGILAVLSPQKDWFMNVSLGERVASTLAHKQGFKWDSAMSDVANEIYGKPQYKPLLDAVKGKRLEELKDPVEKAIWIRTHDQAHNPREHFVVTPEGDFSGVRTKANGEPAKTGWGSNNEIAKAVSIFDNPTRENISARLGGEHKVRNFYMNIYDPHSASGHTTIDTHAVAAGLLRPLSGNTREVSHNFGSNFPGEVGPKNSAFTGKGGTYGLYHEGYQRAAKERDILPREMQSITWEAVRGLFPDTFKSAKNAQAIEDIWKQHKSGKITVDEARKQILEKAGGINEPEWKE